MVMAGSDYGIGFGDVREVADAVTAYVELRVAVMKSTFDHNVAMAALAKATGTLDGGSELFYMAPPEPAPAHGENREPNQPTAIETHRDRTVLAALKVARASEGAVGQEGEPQVIIRKTVDDAFAVLKDKSLATPRMRPKRIGALRTIADRVFDWAEMAKSSLGVQWRTLHAPDRARFVEVFKDLLAAQYIDDIDRFQGTEKVTVDGADHEGEDVNVHTTLITAAHDHVPIDYRMRNEQSRWAVVDISIEGVSMVNHFRSTFASALANMSADQLIEKLRQQLTENLRP
jgi:phospholipid transport system substrate-binding protein